MESNGISSDFIKNLEIVKNGKSMKFTIQMIPKDRYEEAADFMCKYYVPEESLCKSQNIKDDPEAVQEMRTLFLLVLEDNLSVGAFFENPEDEKPIMAAVNLLFLGGEGQKLFLNKIIYKSDKLKRIKKSVEIILATVDVEKLYGGDKFLHSYGLTVDPSFRGNALGYHLLMARHDVGRKNNITSTYTIFTSPISTKLGLQAGYELLSTTSSDEIVDENGKLLMPAYKAETFKLMGMRLV